MDVQNKLGLSVLAACRDVGISSLIFRNMLAKKLDLNLSESLCLSYLAIRESLSPSELSRLIGLTTGSTTTMLDRLEKMGYIQRIPSEKDRRKLRIILTDSYKKEAHSQVINVQKAHKELIAEYSKDDLELILRFLQGFVSNLASNSEEVQEFFKPQETES